MTPAAKAIHKLKGIINIGYYLNQSDMDAIMEACNNYVPPSAEPVAAKPAAKVATPKVEVKGETK